MPRLAKELSALAVKRLVHPEVGHTATFAVGGVSGLLLQMTPTGGKSWILRTKVGALRREIGLGGYPDISLAAARDRAREAKEAVRRGQDPVEQKKATRAALLAAQKRGLSFADAVDKYLASKLAEFKNDKHRKQWRSTLDAYAKPAIGSMLVSDIGVADVQRVLVPIWSTKTETASRLRGRIEGVLSWATVNGHRGGDNPARWNGNLKELLPKPNKITVAGNHPALALDDVAAWFQALKLRPGVAAQALQFAAMTGARSGEVRGATWQEIDFDSAIWVVPASRMKAGSEHRVPLTEEMIVLLKAAPKMEGSDFLFAAPRGGALSDMTLSAVMRRMHKAEVEAGRKGWIDRRSGRVAVPHGLRSTFRDWCAEKTEYSSEMAEIALAHRAGSEVERAYRRGDMVEKRRAMMAAWGNYLSGDSGRGQTA